MNREYAIRGLLAASLFSLLVAGCSDQPEPAAESKSEPSQVVETAQSAAPAAAQIPQVLDTFQVGPDVYVRALEVEQSNNSLWVGTSTGVHQINLEDNTPVLTFTRDHGLANEYVFAIHVDQQGYKWFGTNAGGVSRYKDEEWRTYFPMHGLADYWV